MTQHVDITPNDEELGSSARANCSAEAAEAGVQERVWQDAERIQALECGLLQTNEALDEENARRRRTTHTAVSGAIALCAAF